MESKKIHLLFVFLILATSMFVGLRSADGLSGLAIIMFAVPPLLATFAICTPVIVSSRDKFAHYKTAYKFTGVVLVSSFFLVGDDGSGGEKYFWGSRYVPSSVIVDILVQISWFTFFLSILAVMVVLFAAASKKSN